MNGVDKFQGHLAFHFEWVDGITVSEWLLQTSSTAASSSSSVGGGVDLSTRLKVAMAIAKSVLKFHEAGVIHNGLSCDDIILHNVDDAGDSSEFCVTLIDLARASIIDEAIGNAIRKDGLSFSEKAMRKDLHDLGNVLYAVLGGDGSGAKGGGATNNSKEAGEDDKEDYGQQRRRKRGNNQRIVANSLPPYLISLISALIPVTCKDGRGGQYSHVKDVLIDLQEASKRPDIYLKNDTLSGNYLPKNSLKIPPDSFYGRRSEVSMVLHSLDTVLKFGGKPVVTVVSGYAGTGKTTLLRQIDKPLGAAKGYMICCKFDRTSPPDTVLVIAIDAFFGGLLNSDNLEAKTDMRLRIEGAVGDHVR